MPVYLPKGQKPHTTKEANEARLMTKVLWILESYHARLKKWRFSQTGLKVNYCQNFKIV